MQTILNFCQSTVIALAKPLRMRVPQVRFEDRLKAHNATLTGMYLPEFHAILLNPDWVETANPAEVLMTLFHEFRHSYQAEAVNGRAQLEDGIDLRTLSVWKREINDPIQPDSHRLDDPNYLSQSIERDALDYAKRTLEAFFSQGT